MIRFLAPAALALTLISCSRAVPANVAAMVNGRAITYADVEKQYESQFGTPNEPTGGDQVQALKLEVPRTLPNEPTSDDQVQIQKLEVLRTLIDSEIMFQRAEK